MKKRIDNDPLTGGQRMYPYKQRCIPWSGRDSARTHAMRQECCEDLAGIPATAARPARPGRPDSFFRDMIYEDEKTFELFGHLNRQTHR